VNGDMDQPELDRQTALTESRYDRIAPLYDAMEWLVEHAVMREWRQQLWSRIEAAGRILEVGVGTGKNIPYYPPEATVTGIDLSERMLDRARRRAEALGVEVDLPRMDAQHLAFPDDSFDAAVATFVFCSVPVPTVDIQELGRVVKPGGDIWLLEHVRIDRPLIGPLMDALNPIVAKVTGANINRPTVENVRRAGLRLIDVEDVLGNLVKLIHVQA
jgi:ubiquinone/menaquinone biosynthesis C-methylase UbiE